MKLKVVIILLGLFCLVQLDSHAQVNESLVGYWPLNGNGADSSGYQNDGVVYGTTPTLNQCDEASGAMSFNFGYITLDEGSSAFNLDTEITISGWVNFASFPDSLNSFYILSKRNSFLFSVGDMGLYFHLSNRSNSDYYNIHRNVPIQNDFDLNKWYHIVVGYSEITDQGYLYINGQQVSSDNIGNNDFEIYNTPFPSNHPLCIGCGVNDDFIYIPGIDGSLDEIKIFDKLLNEIEIFSLFEEGLCEQQSQPIITQLISPTSCNTSQAPIVFIVENKGITSISQLTHSYSLNGSPFVSETLDTFLLPNDSIEIFSFTNILDFSSTGTYDFVLAVIDNNGQTDTLYKTLVIPETYPEITVSNDTIICQETTLLLSASGAEQYIWFSENFVEISSENSVLVTPGSSQNYYVIDPYCFFVDSVGVTVSDFCIDNALLIELSELAVDLELSTSESPLMIIPEVAESEITFNFKNLSTQVLQELTAQLYVNGELAVTNNLTSLDLSPNQVEFYDFGFTFETDSFYHIKVVAYHDEIPHLTTELEGIVIVNPEEVHYAIEIGNNNGDRIEVKDNDLLDLSINFTLECWVNALEDLSTTRTIWAKNWCGTSGQAGMNLGFRPTGKLSFGWISSGNSSCSPDNSYISTEPIATTGWMHIALIHFEDSIKFIVNGEEVQGELTNGSYGPVNINEEPFLIGNYKNSAGAYNTPFNGQIDHLRIWKETRTSQEIKSGMLNDKQILDDEHLITLFDFSENTSQFTYDKAQNFQASFNGDIDWIISGAPIKDLPPGFSDLILIEQNIQSKCGLTSTEQLTVSVLNYGFEPMDSVSIGYTLNGQASTIELIDTSIHPGDTLEWTITQTVNLTQQVENELVVFINDLSDLNNSNDTLVSTIFSYPPVLPSISEDQSVCFGEEFEIQASGGNSYQYLSASGAYNTTNNPASFIGINSEKIYVAITNQNGCTAMDSMNIQVFPLPEKPLLSLNDQTNCVDDSLILFSTNYNNITWNTGNSNDTLIISSGNYYAIALDESTGCYNYSDTITISNYPIIEIIEPSIDAICLGDSIFLEASSGTEWNWNPGNFNTQSSYFQLNSSAFVSLEAGDGFCNYSDSIFVTVIENQPPEPVTSMIPIDGSEELTLPVLLSWAPGAFAINYFLKVWEVGQNDTLKFNGLTSINYLLNENHLNFGTTYEWKVISKNPCFSTEGSIQSFTVRNLPNLVVDSIFAPEIAFSGQTIQVSWQIKNIGLGSTLNGSWRDYVYISPDSILNINSDKYLGRVTNFSALEAGESYSRENFEVTIPDGYNNIFYIFIYTDKQKNLQETSNSDNWLNHKAIEVELANYPDLIVENVAPPIASFSGQTIQISYVERNINEFAEAKSPTGTWKDRIYIKSDNTESLNNAILLTTTNVLPISPLDSVVITVQAELPPQLFGEYWIAVEADSDDQVYEFAFTDNTTVSPYPINISLTPPPDLEISDYGILQDTLSNKEEVIVSYQVSNSGSTPTINGYWKDRIYISEGNEFSLNNSTLLKDVNRFGNLNPGSFYNKNESIVIPNNINGAFYIHIITDFNNQEFEYTFESNNNAVIPVQIFSPDINYSFNILNTDSLFSGSIMVVDQIVENIGEGQLINARPDFEFLYCPNSQSLNSECINLSNRDLGSFSILSDSAIILRDIIQLRNEIHGDYVIRGIADYEDEIFENGNEENEYNVDVSIELSNSPNLVLAEPIVIPDTLEAGFSYSFSFAVQNIGNKNASPTWNDKLLLVNKNDPPSLDPRYTKFINSSQIQNDTLKVDSIYLANFEGILSPNIREGYYTLHLLLDQTNSFYEHQGEYNTYSFQIYVKSYPPADLNYSLIDVETAFFSGQNYGATYQVENISINDVLSTNWKDAIVLSEDNILDENDAIIGTKSHNTALSSGASYTKSIGFAIPNGLSGDYYLFGVSDYLENVNDTVRSNNSSSPQAINITLSTPVDLVLESLDIDSITIGQPYQLVFTIKNNNDGIVSEQQKHRFVISNNNILSTNDPVIFEYVSNMTLQPYQSYTDTITFTLPFSNFEEGNFFFGISLDHYNKIYEHLAEQNNISMLPVRLVIAPPADLEVQNILTPSSILAGAPLSIQWSTVNNGPNDAIGMMTESIWLSQDETWDINDVLFGTKEHDLSLASGQLIQNTLVNNLSGVILESYYVIIRTDIRENFLEANELNNTTSSSEKIDVEINLLEINSTVNDTLVDFQPLYYRTPVNGLYAGETILFTISSEDPIAQNQMFISLNDAPTPSNQDFTSSEAQSQNQSIVVPEVLFGNAYMLNTGISSALGMQLIELEARVINFELREVQATEIGNHGPVTLELSGAKFTEDMSVFIYNENDTIEAISLTLINSTAAFASFELVNAIPNIYTVKCEKQIFNGLIACSTDDYMESYSTEIAELEAILQIKSNQIADVTINLSNYPSAISLANTFNVTSFNVEFANVGGIDAINPRIKVSATEGVRLSTTPNGLQNGQGEDELIIPIQESNGLEGILRAGATGSQLVYFSHSGPPRFIVELIYDNQ